MILKYCKICLQTNLRPGTIFSKDQVCPACKYFQKNKKVNWFERFEILKKIVQKKNEQYDCVLGVSGGKDSTRQALWVRDKLGLRPLLACMSYPPEQVSETGVKNLSNLINLGFDVIISSPDPVFWKKLMKLSFFKFGNWAKSTEYALFAFVPQLAIRYKISTILWGENPGLQVGDLKTLLKNGYDGNNLKYTNTLGNYKFDWLPDDLKKSQKLFPYTYPSDKEFKKNNLKIIYLGWFLKDWSLIENGNISITNGLEIRPKEAKNYGDIFRVTALDEDWVTLNQLIKYYKFGFGRATDYVNEEIRKGTLTRKEGINLVSEYDSNFSRKMIKNFCKYLKISEKSFWKVVLHFVNRDLFSVNKNIIKPKFKVGYDFGQ
jgi:N-acetyl sugar amidotransferase